MELAKQGDPNAIAALINRSLTSKGIHASAQLESPQCLKISLQASQVPSQKAIVTIIHRGMMVLQVEHLKSVKIFTYCSDNSYLAWQYEIILSNNLSGSLSNTQILKSSDSGQSSTTQDQEMDLVKNSSGVLLVQKSSQIQQNLQEYQDVIVRFTDEQMGNVRCLTTLTELIQVISKPSFLFTTVASNPNLRSLLDTIAESSKTDEHGDQVITNLSILQPGQQWQKAKVRLVSKIFLEPAEDERPPEDKHQGLTLDLMESEREEPDAEPVVYSNLDIPDIKTSQDNSDDLTANRNIEPESITTDSLFDDFSVSPLSTSQTISDVISDVVISDDVIKSISDDVTSSEETEIADWSKSPSLTVNSLFDDFPEIATNNYGSPDTITESNSEDIIVRLVDDETVPLDEDQDLFNNFSFDKRSPDRNPSSTEMTKSETAIDVIRAKISKQNLDELMLLMNQEDNLKTESQTITSQATNQNATQINADIGTATMERILGETGKHNVNGSDSKDSSTIVTLEDFWGD
jgi:hypothetical protein